MVRMWLAKRQLYALRKEAERIAEEARLAEEKRIAEAKLAAEREAAAKLAEERRIAEAKLAEERRLAEAKLAEERRIAEAKLAEERAAEAKLADEKRATDMMTAARAKLAAEAEEKLSVESKLATKFILQGEARLRRAAEGTVLGDDEQESIKEAYETATMKMLNTPFEVFQSPSSEVYARHAYLILKIKAYYSLKVYNLEVLNLIQSYILSAS